MHDTPDQNWKALESKLGLTELHGFIESEVRPQLSDVHTKEAGQDGVPKSIKRATIIGFLVFIASFMVIESLMPSTVVAGVLTFVIFPVLFLAVAAAMVYFIRHQLAELIENAQHNFLIRTRVLGLIASRLDMQYVANPGGLSKILKSFASWKFCPASIREAAAFMESHKGLDLQSEAIRRSGLAMSSDLVLGSKETKAKAYDQAQDNLQFQDGFAGTRSGISFAVMEWEEQRDDFSYHHLLIHLKLPHRLTGWVEFKNKPSGWPHSRPGAPLKPVGIPYSPFAKAYDVRASDQVEARLVFDPRVIDQLSKIALDNPARGVAFEDHLVIDIRGDNRFDIVNIASGRWSDESIHKTLNDISQMFDLIDSAAKGFGVKASRAA